MRGIGWLLLPGLCSGLLLWGGEPDLKDATDRGANWLIDRHDFKTGLFGADQDARLPGVVAVVLKALCDHPRQYRESVGPFISEPVAYLLKCQQESGAITLPESGRDTYNTALAVLALEATGNPKYESQIKKGKKFLAKCQTKEGGFTYLANQVQGGDLSNTWLALAALRCSEEKPKGDAFKKALPFLRRCQDNPETNPDLQGGGAGTGGGYYQPGKSEFGVVKSRSGEERPLPYGSMSAALLEGYLLCGLPPDAPEVAAALRWFAGNRSLAENVNGGQKGYYYFCMAFARAMVASGTREFEQEGGQKVHWAKLLSAELLKRQRPDGSWLNQDPQWMESNPFLCTGYALNALNLCYAQLKAK